MFDIHEFGVRAAWSPVMFFIVASLAVLYILSVGTYRNDWFKHAEPVPLRKKLSMVSGLALFYLAQGGPIDLAGHLMFSAHMLSMAISYLIVPPLLIYGIPVWLYRSALRNRLVKRALHRVTHPILSLVAFNMLFSLYHMPLVHDFVMTNFTVHTLYYAVLLITSLMMWWNVVAPLPEFERLTDVKKMGYIFANGMLLTPACALIIFAPEAMYATYSDPEIWARALGYCVPAGAEEILASYAGPGEFSVMTPLADQQLGGIVMKFIQEIMYGAILFYNFVRWYKRENPANAIDPIDSIPTFE